MRRNAKCTVAALLFTSFVILLLAPHAAAQSGTVTDDAFLSNNATTQQTNLNGHGLVLVVAGSSATVGIVELEKCLCGVRTGY